MKRFNSLNLASATRGLAEKKIPAAVATAGIFLFVRNKKAV